MEFFNGKLTKSAFPEINSVASECRCQWINTTLLICCIRVQWKSVRLIQSWPQHWGLLKMKVKNSVKTGFAVKLMSIFLLVKAFAGCPFPRRLKLITRPRRERSVYSSAAHLHVQITPFRRTLELLQPRSSCAKSPSLTLCAPDSFSLEREGVECNSVGPAEPRSLRIHETRTTCFKLDLTNTILIGKQSEFKKFPASPAKNYYSTFILFMLKNRSY